MNNLVDKIRQEVSRFGNVKIVSRGSKVSFSHNSQFASVNISNQSLQVEFITPSAIKHTRLAKVKQLKKDKFAHQIDIASETDLDPQVLGWLRIAHATN